MRDCSFFQPLSFRLIYFVLLLIGIQQSTSAQTSVHDFPFRNDELSFDARIDDLVGRLTLEEKVSQMLNGSPAIERLGIPAYDWWNETLHGVARTPYHVTVYPQAIAMAATFDADALFTMASFSATEGRAIYNQALAARKNNTRYVGLTYWTPNINIFRDPRWGRGQETYGEDPYLTGVLGDAFVRGLQGDDPKYLKAAACAKHYAVHSGPEPLRHVFNADVSSYDLWDTYLPAFKKLITGSKVAGVMCAYNAFKTQPCCASDILMTTILREQWNFKGYVTSDCKAIDDFYTKHKTHPDAASAAADAVYHGTDLDCGTEAYKALVVAVKMGKITEKQIDVSVKRLFMIRFRLGMFDPASKVSYAQTDSSVLESAPHRQHALLMARESMVLLKNEGTLPLKKNLHKIVVLGPNADNNVAQLGNYSGTPSSLSTILEGIRQKAGANMQIIYEKVINYTDDKVLVPSDLTTQFSIDGKQGIRAEYFNNKNLAGTPVSVLNEKGLNHFWQEGTIVTGQLPAQNFSARYTTHFKSSITGSVTFQLTADGGNRMVVNGTTVIDNWAKARKGISAYVLEVKKDSSYTLVIEYWQGEGQAILKLEGGNNVITDLKALTDRHRDADAFIFVGGISPLLEGEAMKVNDPGFDGGDRTTIQLPAIQTSVLKALHASGKPVIFVMMTGSAIAIPWESEHIPAILNAWYGGQAAGEAASDILFGDYNPAGRLPVTFYRSDTDLPPFTDYSMKNRTYRYFHGKPLYGFGYGLSYTSFRYDQLITPAEMMAGKPMDISVRVTNTGGRDGDEVVQLYISGENKSARQPVRSLKAFKRISLKIAESKVLQFTLLPEDLAYTGTNGEQLAMTGKISVEIGGCQPGEPNPTTSKGLKKAIHLVKLAGKP